jgi:ferredoxin, 2Fe-2S
MAMVRIHVIIGSRDYFLETYPREYPNLMSLISNTILVDDFGDCKGMGRCGTCHIEVIDGGLLIRSEGNEGSTLGKLARTTEASRLSCQIPVDESLNGAVVRIISEDCMK